VKDECVKSVAKDVVEDVPQDVVQNLAFGARAARALLTTSPPPPSLRSSRLAEMGAKLGSSVAFDSGCGQALLSGVAGGAAQSASMFISALA